MWIALFSQTGSEIANLSKHFGFYPDIILTNNKDLHSIHPDIVDKCIFLDKGFINQYLITLSEKHPDPKSIIVTLHGYLRIVPPEVVNTGMNIINGHPAPVHLYPELKGKDQQEKLFIDKVKYDRYGVIIHRVTNTLDDGEILVALDKNNDIQSIEEAYSKAKELSKQSWILFFEKYYNRKSCQKLVS